MASEHITNTVEVASNSEVTRVVRHIDTAGVARAEIQFQRSFGDIGDWQFLTTEVEFDIALIPAIIKILEATMVADTDERGYVHIFAEDIVEVNA